MVPFFGSLSMSPRRPELSFRRFGGDDVASSHLELLTIPVLETRLLSTLFCFTRMNAVVVCSMLTRLSSRLFNISSFGWLLQFLLFHVWFLAPSPEFTCYVACSLGWLFCLAPCMPIFFFWPAGWLAGWLASTCYVSRRLEDVGS